jgi:hypothetical protein
MDLEQIPVSRIEEVCFHQGRGGNFGGDCKHCILNEDNKKCAGYYPILFEHRQPDVTKRLSDSYNY